MPCRTVEGLVDDHVGPLEHLAQHRQRGLEVREYQLRAELRRDGLAVAEGGVERRQVQQLAARVLAGWQGGKVGEAPGTAWRGPERARVRVGRGEERGEERSGLGARMVVVGARCRERLRAGLWWRAGRGLGVSRAGWACHVRRHTSMYCLRYEVKYSTKLSGAL
jgi:hypothetical protein